MNFLGRRRGVGVWWLGRFDRLRKIYQARFGLGLAWLSHFLELALKHRSCAWQLFLVFAPGFCWLAWIFVAQKRFFGAPGLQVVFFLVGIFCQKFFQIGWPSVACGI